MADTLSVTVTNKLTEIERLGAMVEDFAERHALPRQTVFEINLSLDELLTNIMSYAYDDQLSHDIHVTIALEDGHVSIELEDDGRAYDPFTSPAPDLEGTLEERAIGGLGVHFVRSLMDACEYRRDYNKNIVLLKKNTRI